MKMQSNHASLLIKLLTLHSLLVFSASQGYDFFYLVHQWPGSYCNTEEGCCYPTTGKPSSDFKIQGFWPYYNDGTYPSNCERTPFDADQISGIMSEMQSDWPTLSCPSNDGLTFWGDEWDKHGTCSVSVLQDQFDYFNEPLILKGEIDLLEALQNEEILPNGEMYSLDSIKSALEEGIHLTPGIKCNIDSDGNSQLHQIYLCVGSSAKGFIDCPVFPDETCASSIKFHAF